MTIDDLIICTDDDEDVDAVTGEELADPWEDDSQEDWPNSDPIDVDDAPEPGPGGGEED